MPEADPIRVPPDAHYQPHRVIAVQPLWYRGWSVLIELSDDRRHLQLRLAEAEGGQSEIIDCFHDSGEHPEDVWAGADDYAGALAHTVWHIVMEEPIGCDGR